MAFKSKYKGFEIEDLLDKISEGGGGITIVDSVDQLDPNAELGSLASVVEPGSIKETSVRDLYQPDASMLDQELGVLTAPELLSSVSNINIFAPEDITSVGFEPVDSMVYLVTRDFSMTSQNMAMIQIVPQQGVMAMTMTGGYDTMQQFVLVEYSQDTMSYTIHNDQVEAFNAILANGMDWCYLSSPESGFVITEEQFATIDLFIKAVAGIPSKVHIYQKGDEWDKLYKNDFEYLYKATDNNRNIIREGLNELSSKIPTKTSELTNDCNFIKYGNYVITEPFVGGDIELIPNYQYQSFSKKYGVNKLNFILNRAGLSSHSVCSYNITLYIETEVGIEVQDSVYTNIHGEISESGMYTIRINQIPITHNNTFGFYAEVFIERCAWLDSSLINALTCVFYENLDNTGDLGLSSNFSPLYVNGILSSVEKAKELLIQDGKVMLASSNSEISNAFSCNNVVRIRTSWMKHITCPNLKDLEITYPERISTQWKYNIFDIAKHIYLNTDISSNSNNISYNSRITARNEWTLGPDCDYIGDYAIAYNYLRRLNIKNPNLSWGINANTDSIQIGFENPNDVATITKNSRIASTVQVFVKNKPVENLTISDVSVIKKLAFCGYTLSSITFTSNIISIGDNAFGDMPNLRYCDFSNNTTVPVASYALFFNIPSTCKIIVPDALYDEWIVAQNWSEYADHIIKKSDWDTQQVSE